MKLLIYFAFVLALIAGCRRELPVENDQPLSGNNLAPVAIISPLDSDEYTIGEEVHIQWLPVNERVNIELYRKSEFKVEIAADINVNGEYLWVVPDNLEASVHYRIKIILRANPANYVFSEEFTIKGF